MNETVKAALLDMRRDALRRVDDCASDLASARRRVTHAEELYERALFRADDLSAFLRDNGVDLVAVNAEAVKARPAINPGGQHSVVVQQRGLYQDSLIGQNQGHGQRLQAFDRMAAQYDPTAGLAKALDEA